MLHALPSCLLLGAGPLQPSLQQRLQVLQAYAWLRTGCRRTLSRSWRLACIPVCTRGQGQILHQDAAQQISYAWRPWRRLRLLATPVLLAARRRSGLHG